MTQTQDIVLTRHLDAAVDTVWRAWTDPELFRQWWGPVGFHSNGATIDLREGGRFIWNMHGMIGSHEIDMHTAGTYTRVVPGERFEFVQGISDADGNILDPVTLGMPADFPTAIRSAVILTPSGSGTELTAIEYDWAIGEQRTMSEGGLEQCIDKLEAFLPGLVEG
jgi:uncharacterized protein YndB with AHSA1/START domain